MPRPRTHNPATYAEEQMRRTQLFEAMRASGIYEEDSAIFDSIREMVSRVADGEDPSEVLHEEGFEPDFVYDLIP